MNKSLAFNLVKNVQQDDPPHITQLFCAADLYKSVGMKIKAKELKTMAALARIALKLEASGLALLVTNPAYGDEVRLNQIKSDGKLHYVRNSMNNWWRMQPLKNSKVNIPLKILEKLPKELSGMKTYLFEQRIDPIIAVRIKRVSWWKNCHYYIAVAQWE